MSRPSNALALRHSTNTAVRFHSLRAPTTQPQVLRLYSKHRAASTCLPTFNPHSATAAQRLTANRRIGNAPDGFRCPFEQSAAQQQSVPYVINKLYHLYHSKSGLSDSKGCHPEQTWNRSAGKSAQTDRAEQNPQLSPGTVSQGGSLSSNLALNLSRLTWGRSSFRSNRRPSLGPNVAIPGPRPG